MMIPNPLQPIHEAANVEFQAYGEGVQIPQTFGLPQAEYAAIHKGAALMDLPQRGVLQLTGKDRLPFLNNLLTNQTFDKNAKMPLAANTGVYAFLLNTKGRITTDMNVLELGDRTLLEMDARVVPTIEAFLNKYIFVDQVKVESLVGRVHLLAMHGPNAAGALGEGALKGLAYLQVMKVSVGGQEVVVYRDDVCGVPGYFLLVPAEGVGGVWGALAGVSRPTGWAAFNAARIEAGRPLFGIDFDDTVLPAETSQFNRAVSVTKGCYLGQEIVARMHARNQVPKLLVGMRMLADALPIAGTPIMDGESNTVGVVTSSTVSPLLSNAPVLLGYVKKPLFAVGTRVRIPAEGAVREAEVVEVPFVK